MQMRSTVIFLGAGKPYRGDRHVALTGTTGRARVIDWLLQATAAPADSVQFVGGYQIDSVQEQYPQFNYWINADWQTTASAYSLLQVDLTGYANALVSYSDVLFRRSLVVALGSSTADVAVAVDTQWRTRYAGRTSADLERCEKVCLLGDSITRLGADISVSLATAEFVGCVHFGPVAIHHLKQIKNGLLEQFRRGHLADLVEALRCQGLSVKAVDVQGNWAELNEPQDLAHFILGTKAQTLKRLREMVKLSRIEDQVSFTVEQWRGDRNRVLADIQLHFPELPLVIRSSALSEDGFSNSNAGAYTSLLNIDGRDSGLLSKAIESVLSSYADDNLENQVLVQPMLTDIVASGVVFTRGLSNGSPYYVVNYDDISGSTESVTGGWSNEHKTLVMHRETSESNVNIPVNLKCLLPALREVEELLSYDSLDIEFAVTVHAGLHILQVRPIAVDHSELEISDKDVLSVLDQVRVQFVDQQQPRPFVVGGRTLFGIMPDWNPAEIIGTTPTQLAISLYRRLIMDDTWATQRADYGYRDVRPHPLLVSFAGHPYVDVRASFNSFIPAVLNEDLAKRLVEFYLEWLARNPHLHDKVEFDVVPTCFALDFGRWNSRLLDEGGFTENEVAQLRDALLKITAQAIARNDGDLATIALLEKRFKRIDDSRESALDRIHTLLHDCQRYGALPFAHLARSAFVAITLLRSAVSTAVLTDLELDSFLSSIRTVSHTLTEDAHSCLTGKLSWSEFVSRYKHLRPGTYDITSLSYGADPERYLRPIVASATHDQVADDVSDGQVWQSARERLVSALVQNGLNCDAEQLESFLRRAIQGREYAKFMFTRNLSRAMDELVEWAEPLGVTREDLAYISIDSILQLRGTRLSDQEVAKLLVEASTEGRTSHQMARCIELPPLLCGPQDFSAFLYPATQPNFVGTGQVTGCSVDLNKISDDVDLAGKIALIPKADPGYDWLFGRQIAGLITMYGGANSHMAIRAAEFGLPAALGVGETLYRTLAAAEVLDLNAGNRVIRVVR